MWQMNLYENIASLLSFHTYWNPELHLICVKCFAGGTDFSQTYALCRVRNNDFSKGGNKAKWELHLVYCRNVRFEGEGPGVHFLINLCQGLMVLFLGEKKFWEHFLLLSFSWHFYTKSTIIKGLPPWRNLRLSVLPKSAIMIIHELLLVGFKPTTFYLSAYHRYATFWLLGLPTKLLRM